ncbi:hypothetical protein [Caulobacter sp. 17J65-9]|uniref:hypothetical protein n=1 Tax=Caulobacter sp. 17J65-9 TaxID=2709382 RepID=UPI0013C6D1BD|nr:hypothetical protein [Caulobacter sp. 17J65-9]NEX91180.1 hypothetical protein [Caulobacter sp. 17J65-9]
MNIDAITSEWNALTLAQQEAAWMVFLKDLFAGEAPANRFFLVLMPLWDSCEAPEKVQDAALDLYDAEMQEELAFNARYESATNVWFDRAVTADDVADDAFWDRFDPAMAEAILGCPI